MGLYTERYKSHMVAKVTRVKSLNYFHIYFLSYEIVDYFVQMVLVLYPVSKDDSSTR